MDTRHLTHLDKSITLGHILDNLAPEAIKDDAPERLQAAFQRCHALCDYHRTMHLAGEAPRAWARYLDTLNFHTGETS